MPVALRSSRFSGAQALALVLALAIGVAAGCMPSKPAGAPATGSRATDEREASSREPARPGSRRPSLHSELLSALNRVRREQGLQPLAVDSHLETAAREHSRRMAGGRVPFGHDGFAQRIAGLPQRPRAAAENVARLSSSRDAVDRVLERWTRSRAHRNNLLGDWTHTGLAVAAARDGALYVTQIYSR